jgi:hypothetical protein
MGNMMMMMMPLACLLHDKCKAIVVSATCSTTRPGYNKHQDHPADMTDIKTAGVRSCLSYHEPWI